MKVLFLDIDGVLNSWGGHDGKGGILGIHRTNVELLNSVVRDTGCEVVLSSTWRLVWGIRGTNVKLRNAGACFDLFDDTPISLRRGMEIQIWLSSRSDVSHYAVVDDGLILGHDGAFVRTNMQIGLEQHHCDALVSILNGEPNCMVRK